MNVYFMYGSKLPKPIYSDSLLDKQWWSCSAWPIESQETSYGCLDLNKKHEAKSPLIKIFIIRILQPFTLYRHMFYHFMNCNEYSFSAHFWIRVLGSVFLLRRRSALTPWGKYQSTLSVFRIRIRSDPYHWPGSASGNVDLDPGTKKNRDKLAYKSTIKIYIF